MEQTIGIIIAAGAIGFAIFVMIKQFKETWEGKLVDKNVSFESDEDGYRKKVHKLVFLTTEGNKKTQSVGKREFNNAVIGDSYIKKKGSFKAKRA